MKSCREEQFYLIWPFLLVLQKTRDRAKLLCLITVVLSCVYRIALWRFTTHPEIYWEFVLSRVGELAAGGWLALVYRGGGNGDVSSDSLRLASSPV